MREVEVDAASRRVRVQAGATLREMDAATNAHGLAVPTGVFGTTGVAGLTLGGGIGHLARTHGLSIDSLVSADMVLADGSVVIASEDSHPDLFWAIRGGGGNFGVVTSFEFRAYPVANVVAGPMMWPLERSAEIMRAYDDVMCTGPDELGGFFAFLTVPPVDAVPGAPAAAEDVRRRLVLLGRARGRRGGARADARARAGARRRHGDAAADDQRRVRRPAPVRPAVVLEGRLHRRAHRRRDRRARRAGREACRPPRRRCTCTRSTARSTTPPATRRHGRIARRATPA